MSTQPAIPGLRRDIAGHSVVELAEKFGTPTYVYDTTPIDARIQDLQHFDLIRFAQKACSNLAILDHVRRQGVVVDAVSAGEIRRAMAAGYNLQENPPAVVYCADLFDQDSLELVIKHDIHVNCGSPDMIDQLGEVAPGRNITLRINPGFGHGHSQKTNTGGPQSKHGIWHEEVEDCLLRADRHGLGVTGIHMHIGSGSDFEHLAQVCGALEETARRVGRSITSVSAGGGLPVPYRDGEAQIDTLRYFELWDQSRQRLAKEFGHPISLEIEPGRYLSAEAGFLVAEIRSIKKMGENLFYLVDAGFNNLARPILYGAYHPMSISPRHGGVPDTTAEVVVGGPLCESGDIFTQEEGGYVCSRRLPVAKVGDYLVIECAGAYGQVMSSNYNSKPFAAEVMIRDHKVQLIRKRQTFADLIQGEVIPKS